MSRILLKNLTKRFGETTAVDNLNLKIRDKEFMVLLGPSGSGKTTTLNLIAGLEMPNEGEIYIGNDLVNDLEPGDRNIAMVFQSYALYPHMNVFDNMAFSLKLRKLPKKEIREKVEKTAKLLNVEKLLNRKPKELSGGEMQRTALGRALVREPKVFLLDEPLSNLDAKLRFYMRTELKKLHEKIEVTTVYVTHDQVEAMTMADRIAIFNQGKLQQVGSPEKIYDHPENLFVAGFIGSPPMNLIKGTLTERDGRLTFSWGGANIDFSIGLGEAIKRHTSNPELVLGIRPNDVLMQNKPSKGFMKFKIYTSELIGTTLILTLETDGKLIKTEVPRSVGARINDKVWIKFPENQIHIFDEATTKKFMKISKNAKEDFVNV